MDKIKLATATKTYKCAKCRGLIKRQLDYVNWRVFHPGRPMFIQRYHKECFVKHPMFG